MTELYSAKHWAEKSRKQAVGSLEENVQGSAKYWAEQAKTAMDNVVHLDDTQIITGAKTFKSDTPFLNSAVEIQSSQSYESSGLQSRPITYTFNGGNASVCQLVASQDTATAPRFDIRMFNPTTNNVIGSALQCGATSSGVLFAKVPTPAKTSNDTSVATTAWVRTICSPDYTKAISVSSGLSPASGLLVVKFSGQDNWVCRLKVNSVVIVDYTVQAYSDTECIVSVLVKAGDKLEFAGEISKILYPMGS